jgi:hypothetical protein
VPAKMLHVTYLGVMQIMVVKKKSLGGPKRTEMI